MERRKSTETGQPVSAPDENTMGQEKGGHDKLVQQAISDMEKLMAARQQSKEQERSNTKKSVLDALRSLKAKKQEQPAQEQDKPKKAKTKGMEL